MRRRYWVETEGTVGGVETESGVDGAVSYSVVFTYKVDGHFYGGTFTSYTKELYVGDPLPVKYDPANPEKNNWVVKETVRKWVIGLFIAAFLALILFGKFIRVR